MQRVHTLTRKGTPTHTRTCGILVAALAYLHDPCMLHVKLVEIS